MSDKFRISEVKRNFLNRPFTSRELYHFYLNYEPDLNENTFRWRIYNLKKEGIITSVKRGTYMLESRIDFIPPINLSLKRMYNKIKEQFPYIDISIWETNWLNNYMVHQPRTDNVIVEVDKDAMESVFSLLQETRSNVFLNPSKNEIDTYLLTGKNNIVVKNLVVESPIQLQEKIHVPKIEKILVDLFIEKDLFIMYQGKELANIYELIFETFNINQSTLNRYATKRNVKERLMDFILEETSIDKKYIFI
ncbi:hypothetical protein D5E69_22375 [Rossellomorea marisflavi]|uniref:DUF6577 family protein n=1 Tax=Rossellomorea marisflavi TaxID=189381 RepID=UPI0013191211|nr:DUF6577 family protein [Rossellomorea marisflavi]QHA38256.1 hypothetical protein D5E69_22375 [Rossellomorea marisflavi]